MNYPNKKGFNAKIGGSFPLARTWLRATPTPRAAALKPAKLSASFRSKLESSDRERLLHVFREDAQNRLQIRRAEKIQVVQKLVKIV